MKSLTLRGMNKIGNAMTYTQRRFVLDRLGVAALLDSFAAEEFDDLQLPNGIRLSFSPLLHGHIFKHGELAYEGHVARALEACLGRGDAFYDAGANVGVFAFLAATLVGEKGAVHAFEPEPNNLLCFQRSLATAPVQNVELHAVALGAEDGRMTFDRREGAFSGRLVAGEDEAGSAGVCEIEVRAIDSLVAEGLPPPNLIKIDVMGGEGPVLEGARRTLRAHRPAVLCEMHPDNPAGVARAFAALRQAGYVCQALDEGCDGPPDGAAADFLTAPPDWNRPYHILARAV